MRPETTPATTEDLLRKLLSAAVPGPRIEEVGHVSEVADGIARVNGLSRALADEVLEFAGGLHGIVFDMEPGHLGVVLLGPSARVRAGESARRTGRLVDVPVGSALLGRVVDALGKV